MNGIMLGDGFKDRVLMVESGGVRSGFNIDILVGDAEQGVCLFRPGKREFRVSSGDCGFVGWCMGGQGAVEKADNLDEEVVWQQRNRRAKKQKNREIMVR